MIAVREFEKDLKKLGDDYFIHAMKEVPDIAVWAKETGRTLTEPHLPMKLVAENGDKLSMVIQSEIDEEMLSDVIRNLGIRWSVRDNATDIEKKIDSTKKRLAFCFLKEYARALNKVEGDELLEDEWVLEEMEYLGYFEE
jgi:hypothetical protein